ncbi:hypothetical protein [Oceanobacillus manasiensis]|uniref:hypothetical protein n=1 Tax=Oceanobacillus manasiensis TaxID=586413 RepID=UPI0005A89EF3|nr:hypothetical protein [Oceanobacillus manasiensis]
MKRLSIVLTGIIPGIFLGLFLWLVQKITAIKVYTLLMNVDYIPVLKEWNMHGLTEFLLHLVVSVILVCVLYTIFKKWEMQYSVLPYIIANTIIGLLLYGTTALSSRTPDLIDLTAIFYWLVGHALYGVVVGMLFRFLGRPTL